MKKRFNSIFLTVVYLCSLERFFCFGFSKATADVSEITSMAPLIEEAYYGKVSFLWNSTTFMCSVCPELNATKLDYFQCGYFNDTESSERYFQDPLGQFPVNPNDYIAFEVNITVHGRFNCRGKQQQQLLFLLQDTAINLQSGNLPTSPGCKCGNCAFSVFFSSRDNPFIGTEGLPNYDYLRQNKFSIFNVNKQRMCLSRIDMTITFTRGRPKVSQIGPRVGPVTGGTAVSFSGTGFELSQNVSCRFGTSDPIPATVTEKYFPLTFTCISPSIDLKYSLWVIFFIDVYTTKQQRWILKNQGFTYYVGPEVKNLDPSSGDEGTHVMVHCANLIPSDSIYCRFGNAKVSGALGDDGENPYILCKAPPGSGNVTVSVSLNGQQWAGNLIFTYDASSQPFIQKYFWLVILLSAVGAVALVILLASIIFYSRKKHTDLGTREKTMIEKVNIDPTPLLRDSPKRFSGQFSSPDLGKIQILEKIGRGTHGEVFKAIWQGTIVAVKKLPAQLITDEFLQDFVMEAQLMRSLRHPNVLQFLGASTNPPDICIVMEYMSRGSLFQIIHDKSIQLDWPLIRKIMTDAAKGMNYLHNSNPKILHRDFKSHNLLLDENWKCKVCDFGLSRMLSDAPAIATMTACGTPCWAAPEILRHQRYSEKADVYSYGVVLWECVTRQVPYQGMPPFQIVFAVGTEGIRPPLPLSLHPDISKLVQDCWSETPDRRPGFDAILNTLDALNISKIFVIQ